MVSKIQMCRIPCRLGSARLGSAWVGSGRVGMAEWAKTNGLFANVSDSAAAMDQEITALAERLAKSSPEAQQLLKKVCWEGTEHWDELLAERASMSGALVLSDFTVQAINQFKTK